MTNQTSTVEAGGEACVLTDDELVALAVEADGAWPLPLPTVATWDTEELGRSAMRGWRSLALRGGLTEAGTALDELDPVGHASSATSTLVLFVGDNDAQPITWDYSYGAVRADGGWLLDEITAGGIHRLWRVDAADAIAKFMTTALGEVHSGGLPHGLGANAVRIYLAATDSSGSRMIGVRREEIIKLSTDGEGRVVSRETAGAPLLEVVRDLVVAGSAST